MKINQRLSRSLTKRKKEHTISYRGYSMYSLSDHLPFDSEILKVKRVQSGLNL